MTPYYEHAGITIYHGDCRDVMEQWEGLRTQSFDLLLTDPPYGIGSWSSTGGNSLSSDEIEGVMEWDRRVDAETLRTLIRYAKTAIIWGGNYYGDELGACRGPLVWNKIRRGMHYADGEFAWTNLPSTLRIFDLLTDDGDVKGQRLHPTQKPEELMSWCIRRPKTPVRTVLDPFMGSGTTLVAAKRLGLQAVGIEREARYCDIAINRLKQDTLNLFQGETDAANR